MSDFYDEKLAGEYLGGKNWEKQLGTDNATWINIWSNARASLLLTKRDMTHERKEENNLSRLLETLL